MCYPARADDSAIVQRGDGIELASQLVIGKHIFKGRVGPKDVQGMMDEPATNLQKLYLAPPGGPSDFNKWVQVGTCREWMRLRDDGWTPDDNADQGSDSEFLRACGTLFAIEIGHPAKTSYLPQKGLGDIRLYSSRLLGAFSDDDDTRNKLLAAKGRSFGDLEHGAEHPITISLGTYPKEPYLENNNNGAADSDLVVFPVSDNEIEYFYGGYDHHLRLIARGDFTGDGNEDFLVAFGFSGSGTAAEGELLVLTRRSEHAAIEPVACLIAYEACVVESSLRDSSQHPKP